MKVLVCVLILFVGALGAPNPDGRIIGGWDAVRGQFPSIVSLNYCIIGICQHSCGGSLISARWVLTAAHCATEVLLPSLGTYSAIVGILDLDDNNPERQSIRVSQTIVHSGYEGGVNPNDVALFYLASSVVFNAYVQPATLPRQGEDFSGQTVLAGWGSIGGTVLPQLPNRLQLVNKPIVQINECDAALTSVLSGGAHPLDLNSNICSGPLTGGISACSGDSGGPLIKDGVLIGVVSWGINPCGTVGAPTVYGKVSYFVNWIRETTGIKLVE